METNGGPDNTPVDSEIAGTVWFRLVLPDFDERRQLPGAADKEVLP